MKTHGKISAMLCLATAFIWMGCSSTEKHHTTTTAPAGETPAVQQTTQSSAPSGSLVSLTKRVPAEASLGETYCYELTITASQQVGNVVVADAIPEGASFVSAEPPAQPEGKGLVWRFPSLPAGETKTIKVCLKAEKEGDLAACATVSAVPMICASTMVGKPVLAIEKTGPETAILGDEIVYLVKISNKGTAVARNVRGTDVFPEGTTHWSGEKLLSLDLGDLAPGASTTNIPVRLKTTQRGKICNTATAEASNAAKVSAEACTLIQQPGVKIVKTAIPVDLLLINRTAAFNIEVSNIGDTTLTDVVVTDVAAAETQVADAGGGTTSGNTTTWNVGTLKPGEKKTMTVKIMSKVPGKFCNTASVSTAQGLKDSSEACNQWFGVTGVLVEVVDDPDPIQVGETATYTIRVTNQGSTQDIVDLAIKAQFPNEMTPQTASGSGTVSGKAVTFPVVPTLAPKASVTYTITAKGVATGDARINVEVTTKYRQNPIVEVESTTIY
jgi:uncharacterized repeat protein (TIGR01451 family)